MVLCQCLKRVSTELPLYCFAAMPDVRSYDARNAPVPHRRLHQHCTCSAWEPRPHDTCSTVALNWYCGTTPILHPYRAGTNIRTTLVLYWCCSGSTPVSIITGAELFCFVAVAVDVPRSSVTRRRKSLTARTLQVARMDQCTVQWVAEPAHPPSGQWTSECPKSASILRMLLPTPKARLFRTWQAVAEGAVTHQ